MIDGIPVLLLVWCLVAGALVSAFGVLGGIVWVVVKLFGRRKARDGWHDILPYPTKELAFAIICTRWHRCRVEGPCNGLPRAQNFTPEDAAIYNSLLLS